MFFFTPSQAPIVMCALFELLIRGRVMLRERNNGNMKRAKDKGQKYLTEEFRSLMYMKQQHGSSSSKK